MAPRAAAAALTASLKDPGVPVTVADASAASGLPLRDAERGLQHLTHEYRGHLRVTEKGELLYLFPNGFTKPWETRDAVDRALSRVGGALAGAGRFVVRAWLMIVILAYAAIFLAVIVGSLFTRGSGNRRLAGGDLLYVLFRVLGDALFWTFRPFSPFYAGGYYASARTGPLRAVRRAPRDEVPFYEKVNRFFFGPTLPVDDPMAMEKKILAAIRAGEGRVGLADVMRATGLPRDQADPLMAKLMVNYEGEVNVSEAGGITYTFASLRRTALEEPVVPPPAAWEKKRALAPFTGNDAGANALIVALNAFNGLMALWAIDAGLTIDKLPLLFGKVPLAALPYSGTPILLGVVPLVMSLALLLLPVGRALARPRRVRAVERENARLSLLRAILGRIESKKPVTGRALTEAWKSATGREPPSEELTREVVALGGDVSLDESAEDVRYRFVNLETEAMALEEERATADQEEKRVGNVEFASDR